MILRRSLFRMGVEIASLHTSVRLRHVVHRIVQTNSIGKNRDLSWKLRTPDRFFDFWYGVGAKAFCDVQQYLCLI